MNILEFMEVFDRCQVSARLCVSAIEHDFDVVAEMSSDDYDAYQKFIRELDPYWLTAIYKIAPVIEIEVNWASYGIDDWAELLKLNPDWQHHKDTHYRAPRFFAGF